MTKKLHSLATRNGACRRWATTRSSTSSVPKRPRRPKIRLTPASCASALKRMPRNWSCAQRLSHPVSAGAPLSESASERNSCIAGSRVISLSRLRNDPSAPRRSFWFWASMSGVSWSAVAKWSCQNSVSFSTSGRCERTIRSSHHSTSWPYSFAGSSGLPSTDGAGPRSCGPGRPSRIHFSVAACPRAAQRRASAWVAPKPARQNTRRTCASVHSGRTTRRRRRRAAISPPAPARLAPAARHACLGRRGRPSCRGGDRCRNAAA